MTIAHQEDLANRVAAIVLAVWFILGCPTPAHAGWMPDGPVIVDEVGCGDD